MLKFIRVFLAVAVFLFLSIFFLDFTETIPLSAHFLAHLQIVPLIQVKMVLILLLWFLITILLGRIYCSVLCPFGILQDIVSRIAKIIRQKKVHYQFHPAMHKTRWFFLLLFILGFAAMPVIVSLLDPYSNYGRLLTFLVRPLYLMGNNYLAGLKPDWFVETTIVPVALPAVLLTLFVTLLVGVLSFFFGRRYCNTICPIGTLLGLFSKAAPFRVRLNSRCVSCGLCEKTCKGECLDSKTKTVDVSRCVDCFNCLSVCPKGGISFSRSSIPVPMSEKTSIPHHTIKRLFFLSSLLSSEMRRNAMSPHPYPPQKGEGTGIIVPRRSFLRGVTASLFFGSAVQAATPPSELPTGQSRVSYKKNHPVLPPGAQSRRHLIHHCTACQLCAAKCPSNVIQPSMTDLGVQGFLVPVLKFDHGFCNYNCTICTQVCPTAALITIGSEAEKHKLQIGRVVLLEENCVVLTQETNCGACAEHCPTGAVTMRPYGSPDSALTIPEIDVDLCVGCGACENICPVKPYRAIYVEGLERHGEAKLAYDPDAKQQEVRPDSFGF